MAAVRLYSEAFDDLIRARLEISASLPYTWHPSQPLSSWQESLGGGNELSQGGSRFLRLPKELREQIYKHVLGKSVMVHVISDSKWYHRPGESGSDLEEDATEEVYTNDLYFDRCFETTTEERAYMRSQRHDPNDIYGSATRACRFQCGSCERHDHCTEIRSGKVFETAFLRVCRQIYREATAVLWESYIFSFHFQHTLVTFVDQLTQPQKHSLRSLHVSIRLGNKDDSWTWDAYDLMSSLGSLPHLRNLHLSLRMVCRGDFQIQLEGLREGSLALWKNELVYFRRPPLRYVTVVVEDLYPHRPCKSTATPKVMLGDVVRPISWTRMERSEIADVLTKKLLSQ